MKRTFHFVRETDRALEVMTQGDYMIWVPKSVCPRASKFPQNEHKEILIELEIEDWWWERNGMEAKEREHGQRKLNL